MRRLLIALILLAAPAAGAADRALAQADGEQERARAAVKAGEIRSLQEILAQLRGRVEGRVLDADLEGSGRDRWTYRIKLLTADGRVVALAVDARTGEILRIKGR